MPADSGIESGFPREEHAMQVEAGKSIGDAANAGHRSDMKPAIPVLSIDSHSPLPPFTSATLPKNANHPKAPAQSRRTPSGFYLRGGVVLCACPDCGAPMSVRLWLLLADCWKCEASIELDEQAEREIAALLESPEETPAVAPEPIAPLPIPAAPVTAVSAEDAAEERAMPLRTSAGARLYDWLRTAPAWLISAILHAILLTLLGLIFLVPEGSLGPEIILSTLVSRERGEGETLRLQNPEHEVAFELPIPDQVDMENEKQRQAMIAEAKEAKTLTEDPRAPATPLPELSSVKAEISKREGAPQFLAARDPRIRAEMVKAEGGTTLTEAAVSRGLRWISKQQFPDGRWKLEEFPRVDGHRSSSAGATRTDTGATALALMPFLGAGQTPRSGIYRDNVAKGLRWLLSVQKEDGDLRHNSPSNTAMYAHGQAAIVLCEAFVTSGGDEVLRGPAQKSIDFIVAAQHPDGGWRYEPGEAGDTSILGWQLMALQSARNAGLHVPQHTLDNASNYLSSVEFQGGAFYSYLPGQSPTHVMTAEAMLCRMYLGRRPEHAGVQFGMKALLLQHPPKKENADIYYWYYATQSFHHFGGREWEQWNRQMRDVLVFSQEQKGADAGSWDPEGPHAGSGGRLYMTSLATCTLEVYYRHLPIFRRIEFADARGGD
jgi:hypothetical protein